MSGLLRCGLLAVTALLSACGSWFTQPSGPPPEVLGKLSRGVNLSFWFTYRGTPGIEPSTYFPNTADFQRIQQLGLRHVRVMFDPAWLADSQLRLSRDRVAELRAGIAQANAAGLLVVLAMNPSSEFKQQLAQDNQALDRTREFWRQLADALSTVPTHQLVLEPLNEPEISDAPRTRAIFEQLAAGIREALPQHTIVVAGAGYSDIPDLVKSQPLADRNIVYSFHFYEPKNFTHQGTHWGWPMWAQFHSLPYPSSPEAVAPVAPLLSPEAREHVLWYGEQRWDRAKLESLIRQAGDWGRQHGVPVWCSEFGTFRLRVRPEHRLAWMRDVRELLAQQKISWTLWDYAGEFGLVSGPQEQRVLDRDAAMALGLSALP